MATGTQAPDIGTLRSPLELSWGAELRATLTLALPLIIAQLAQMALFTTDIVMMGWLGPKFLAAGMLTVSFMHPFLLFGIGVLSAVAPMIAQAKGAGDAASLRRSVRQGFWVALAVSLAMLPVIWNARPIFGLLGQSPELSSLAESYARAAVWLFPPALGFIVLRALLATHDDTSAFLVITLVGVVANAALNYALMLGHWGFPRLELMGSGISTALANLLMFLLLLAYSLTRPAYRAYTLFVRFWRPDWSRFWTILRLGTPIGLMMMAEVGLFAVAALFMGWLGTDELAAHAVALQLAAIAFMVPMGLSHAATVRVGLAHGRRSAEGVRKAGWVSLMMGTGFMALTGTLFWFAPEPLLGLFLDPADPQNQVPLALAVSYLGVAAIFQLADGAQVVSGAVLRGLSDTAMPMVIAIAGYWGIGLPVAYLLAFSFELRGVGVWLGLASGLVSVALILSVRFSLRERFGLV
ncbi:MULTISPECIES: MATE family efflux transporter [Rhodomicrobium]|uniref:MATE family efflux transporter n=1 Tax=Rhodomicrobium TaxID=1068 RepID=UPI000B4B83E5|nr:MULTISPECIES: MATE family efflux transporter [Rhodomicrobium]